MSTNELVTKFGKPAFTADMGKGWTIWNYNLSRFPAGDEMRGSDVIAATLTITNGHLASVGFGYREDTKGTTKRIPTDPSNNKVQSDQQEAPVLKVYVVNDEPITNGQLIDTPQLPKLGYISKTPNLAVTRLKDLALDERAVSQPDKTTLRIGNLRFG